MKPVEQTIFDDVTGNCLQAGVAAILEMPLADVPNFMEAPGDGWADALDEFLFVHGLRHLALDINDTTEVWLQSLPGYYILAGSSLYSNDPEVYHAVVAYGAEIVHDPHPVGDGLRTVEYAIVFVSLMHGENGRVLEDEEDDD